MRPLGFCIHVAEGFPEDGFVGRRVAADLDDDVAAVLTDGLEAVYLYADVFVCSVWTYPHADRIRVTRRSRFVANFDAVVAFDVVVDCVDDELGRARLLDAVLVIGIFLHVDWNFGSFGPSSHVNGRWTIFVTSDYRFLFLGLYFVLAFGWLLVTWFFIQFLGGVVGCVELILYLSHHLKDWR